jgi:hypothetical protein
MPRTHEPNPALRRVAAQMICPACGGNQMRLVIARPSSQYVNLDECIFRCDCGEVAEYIMMRPE